MPEDHQGFVCAWRKASTLGTGVYNILGKIMLIIVILEMYPVGSNLRPRRVTTGLMIRYQNNWTTHAKSRHVFCFIYIYIQ